MMSSSVLDDKTLIALDTLEDMWFFNSPFTNICPFLILVGILCVLLSMRWLPSLLPVVSELLDEIALDLGWLEDCVSTASQRMANLQIIGP